MREAIEITLNLISNAFVFFSFIFFYVISRPFQKHKIISNILSGLVVGLLTIYLMHNPWNFAEGYFFDARSIVILVSALFLGFFPTLIAAAIAVAYRVIIGGSGVYPGVITVVVSFAIGYYWPKIRKPFAKWGIYVEYLVLGLLAHGVVLLGFFSVPYPQSIETIGKAFIPFLGVYPVVTMGFAVILHNQMEGFLKNTMIIKQQTLLQSSIDSTPMMEIFSVDQDYNYMSMNIYHKKQMKKFYDIEPAIGDNYVNIIKNETMKARVIELINSALEGKIIKKTLEVEVEKGKFLEEYYTPIRNGESNIIGVSIFSEDITEKYNYEQNVLKLSYRDPLTNLYNRRHYEEELLRLNQEKYFPLSIVFADINGLKLMNDAFGHNAGDELLVAVAQEFIKTFSSEKNISRIGGDEFAILLSNTPKKSALVLLEKAKENLLNKQINGTSISVAFGLATKTHKENIADVIKEAENDMYANKLFEITSHRSETIKTIMQTLQEKNPREEMHSKRVSLICQSIGKKLEMSANDLRLLDVISALHDIGKITIDERILNKPGKLDKEEWEVIKKHPEVGYRILSASQEYAIVAEDILSHHERYDGTGYPRGLKGEEIPIRARIIALADSYDAMTSHRSYRDALSHQQAIMEIKRCSETQFDPKIVKVFLELYENQTETIKTL